MPHEKSIAEEIGEIVVDAIQQSLQPVEFPEVMAVEVLNPPEPQEIDLSGLEEAFKKFAEQKREKIPAPDFSKVERLLNGILNRLNNIKDPEPNVDISDVLGEILTAINSNAPLPVDFSELSTELRSMVDEVKRIKVSTGYKGGAIGPSKIAIKNSSGAVIDPATSTDTMKGLDYAGNKASVALQGSSGLGVKVYEPRSYISEDILKELKIISKHLSLITGVDVEEHEI